MMESSVGQTLWKVFVTKKFWLKLAQMICAVIATIPCVIFNQRASVHQVNSQRHYTITLAFPFIYDNVTVESTRTLHLREFKFESLLLPSALLYAITTVLALLFTTILAIWSISKFGQPDESEDHIKLKFFVSLGMTFLLLAAICLWMTNLITLVRDLEYQLDFIVGQCVENFVECTRHDVNFTQLYTSVVFGGLLFLLWLVDCIQTFIKMVYTIPEQVNLTTLVRNVELETVHDNNEGQLRHQT